jgi:hypothetical protein
LALEVADAPAPETANAGPCRVAGSESIIARIPAPRTTKRLLGLDEISTTDYSRLNDVVYDAAEFLGGRMIGFAKGAHKSTLAASHFAAPVILAIESFAPSERWVKIFRDEAAAKNAAEECIPMDLALFIPTLLVGQRYFGTEYKTGDADEKSSVNHQLRKPLLGDQAVLFTVAVKIGEKNEPTMYRIRCGDAFVCKCGTSFKVEAWASEIRLLVCFIGRPIKNIFLYIQMAFYSTSRKRTFLRQMLYRKLSLMNVLIWSGHVRMCPLFGFFSRIFTSRTSTICTSRVHASPTRNSMTLLESQADEESLMSRVLEARESANERLDISYLCTTWLLRKMDKSYVYFLQGRCR